MTEKLANPLPTGAYLTKATTEFFSTIRPMGMTAGDLDVRFLGSPQSWKPDAAAGLAGHAATGDLSWRFLLATNGFLQVSLSFNGTTETAYTATVAIPNNSTIDGVRFTRDNATGTVTFYTTRNSGTSWQTIGATVDTPDGALHLSAADVKVGVAPPGTSSFRGTVRSFDYRVDTVSVCNLDLTRAWRRSEGPWVDTHGNDWVKNGDPTIWVVTRAGIARRPQTPDLGNMAGWSGDFAAAESSGSAPTAGTVTCARIIVPEDRTITKVNAYVLSGGSGVTASLNWFSLHNLDGTQIGVTAPLSNGELGTGADGWPLTASVDLKAGIYVVKMLMNGTSAPTFAVLGTSAAVNANGSATYGWRFFTEETAQTNATPGNAAYGIPTTPGVSAARLNKGYLLGVS